MQTNGLLYTDRRVLISLDVLVFDRDQGANPITQVEISNHAVVSLRTVQNSLSRLQNAGLIMVIGGRRGVSAGYAITDSGYEILEAYK
jgi:predicted transcriptional regulator